MEAAEWRAERDARVRRLREYACRSKGALLKDRVGTMEELRQAMVGSTRPERSNLAMPLMLELSGKELEQFQRYGVMGVPEEIVWPA
jgi:hypothetical protein